MEQAATADSPRPGGTEAVPTTRPSSKMAPLGQTRRDFQGYHFFAPSRKKALLKRLKKSTEKLSCYFFTRLERKRS